MTPLEALLSEIETAEKKATPGMVEVFAWHEEDGEKAANHHIQTVSGQLIARCYKRNLPIPESEANAALIVLLRNRCKLLVSIIKMQDAALTKFSMMEPMMVLNGRNVCETCGHERRSSEYPATECLNKVNSLIESEMNPETQKEK